MKKGPGPNTQAVSARKAAFLGTSADLIDREGLLGFLASAVDSGARTVVANHNLHSLALMQSDKDFHRFYDHADLVLVDGMAVVWIARLLGQPASVRHRHATLDWIWPFLELCSKRGLTVAHVGGTEPALSTTRRHIAARLPSLDLHLIDGYFDLEKDSQGSLNVVDELVQIDPTVLLVGLGMPLQERWILDHLDRLPRCLVVTVGGLMGYFGQTRSTPPRWLGGIGLEWVYRLANEPTRLSHRYLVEPWTLLPPVAGEWWRQRSGHREHVDRPD